MKEGIGALCILFYANLLSSQRDCDEILAKERLMDDTIQLELIRRRRHLTIDETANPETTESIVQRRRKSNSDSPFQNPLETKLDLEPNEYRHGRCRFEDFINEYANEKINIKREYFEFLGQPSSNNQFSFISYPFFLSTINKISMNSTQDLEFT